MSDDSMPSLNSDEELMTKSQGDKIIDLLTDILWRLENPK